MIPAEKKPKTALYIGAAAVVVAAAAVGGWFVLRHKANDNLATKRAATNIDAIVGAGDLKAGTTGSAQLKSCPLASRTDLTAFAPDGYKLPSKSDSTATIFADDHVDDPIGLFCQFGTPDDSFEINVARAPTVDFKRAVRNSLSGFTVNFDVATQFRGGTLQPFCATAAADGGGTSFCETDWFNADVEINLGIAGNQRATKLTTVWLKAALPTILNNLSSTEAPSVTVVTTG